MPLTKIVLCAFGSLGDLHPPLAIGLELKARGHRVVLGTDEVYRDKIEAAGLEFHPVRPFLPREDAAFMQRVMDLRSGTEFIIRQIFMTTVRETYEDMLRLSQDADLLITAELVYPAKLVHQKTGVPWIFYMLAPTSFFSSYDPSVFPAKPFLNYLKTLGYWPNQAVKVLASWLIKDWGKPLQDLSQEVGFPMTKNPILEEKYSPELNLAMFSRVLAEPQPDWPANTILTGFPFYDRHLDYQALQPELEEFLAAGSPPIVFTLGSAAVQVAGNFYTESIQAAQALGCRAVLLVGKNSISNLPADMIAVDYAPFSELFPQAAAIVHQGGVGTTGQALRSGRPMLVVPWSHDQPDNAARVERLGVGRTMRRDQYVAARVAAELRILLQPTFGQRAQEVGQLVQMETGTKTACDAIEQFLNQKENYSSAR
jgi:UDP:flavonoid glycosyltransferase YjiC (YdhE family)